MSEMNGEPPFRRPEEVYSALDAIRARMEAHVLSHDLRAWHNRMDQFMAEGAHFIALRGAGSVNGIAPVAAELATFIVRNRVRDLASGGAPVVLLYDGDPDNRERPDIGSVFGGVVDNMQDCPNVVPVAAQSQSWYSPREAGGSLQSAGGITYETYVFPNGVAGSHSALTQSEPLVAYENYEQIYVGAAGPIAAEQLEDLSRKALARSADVGKVAVMIIGAPVNPAVGEDLQQKLHEASDLAAKEKIAARLIQRHTQPYGALFTSHGELAPGLESFPGIEISSMRISVG